MFPHRASMDGGGSLAESTEATGLCVGSRRTGGGVTMLLLSPDELAAMLARQAEEGQG